MLPDGLHALQLDRVQRKMISFCLGLKPRDGESVSQFCRRRSRTTAHISNEQGLWSVRWSRAIVAWSCHVVRNHNYAVWSAPLLSLRMSAELAQRRSENSGRPVTRKEPGFIMKRWTDSVSDALCYMRKKYVFPYDLFERGCVDGDVTPMSEQDLLSHF